jgi:hypothetical protein
VYDAFPSTEANGTDSPLSYKDLSNMATNSDPDNSQVIQPTGSQAPGSSLVVPPYFRRVRAGAGEYAEFYARGFNDSPDPDVSLLVRLHEKPNWVLLPTLIASFSVTVAILFLGWVRRDAGVGDRELGSDIPLLLISVPVVLASWLGLSKQAASLRRISLTTLMGLNLCFLLSIATILYYLVEPTGRLAFNSRIVRFPVLGGMELFSTNPVWFCLSVGSIFLSVYLLIVYVHRFRTYIKRVQTGVRY